MKTLAFVVLFLSSSQLLAYDLCGDEIKATEKSRQEILAMDASQSTKIMLLQENQRSKSSVLAICSGSKNVYNFCSDELKRADDLEQEIRVSADISDSTRNFLLKENERSKQSVRAACN